MRDGVGSDDRLRLITGKYGIAFSFPFLGTGIGAGTGGIGSEGTGGGAGDGVADLAERIVSPALAGLKPRKRRRKGVEGTLWLKELSSGGFSFL